MPFDLEIQQSYFIEVNQSREQIVTPRNGVLTPNVLRNGLIQIAQKAIPYYMKVIIGIPEFEDDIPIAFQLFEFAENPKIAMPWFAMTENLKEELHYHAGTVLKGDTLDIQHKLKATASQHYSFPSGQTKMIAPGPLYLNLENPYRNSLIKQLQMIKHMEKTLFAL